MNMEWTLTLHEEDRYAEVKTGGIADRDGSLLMAKAISGALQEKKIKKILIDHRHITSVSGTTIDVYHRPMEFEKIGVVPGIKVAEVVKPQHKEFFNFFELVCVNRGYIFSVFYDKQSALEWLLK